MRRPDAAARLEGPKNLRATQRLASDLLSRQVGDRLLTSREYQSRLGVGSGTINKSLRTLEDIGAVTLVARGHRGTFITSKHVGRLWTIAELGAVTGLFPPPLPSQSEHLTGELRERFEARDVPLHVLIRRGAEYRVREVMADKADLAVISGGALRRLQRRRGHRRLRTWSLAPFTYYSHGSLAALLRPGLRSARRLRVVGIASDSLDHVEFSRAEFGDDVQYVEFEYNALPLAVAERRVDAALWHRVPVVIPFDMVGITTRPLERREAIELADELSNAVIVTRESATELAPLLDESDVASIRARRGPPLAA